MPVKAKKSSAYVLARVRDRIKRGGLGEGMFRVNVVTAERQIHDLLLGQRGMIDRTTGVARATWSDPKCRSVREFVQN